MQDSPQLPSAYEFERIGEVDCLRAVAAEKARDGGAEGTLLFASNLRDARGYQGTHWQGFAENLHAAILLEPDFDPEQFQQIQYVAVVSLGAAIATHVAPMTSLTYGWPNDLNIAGQKIASVWIDRGSQEERRWLTVTVSVNVMHAPGEDTEDFSLQTMSLREAEGNSDITAPLLLETWSRQFIAEINNWHEKGFAHTLAHWNIRADSRGKPISWVRDGYTLTGTQGDVLDDGSLEVDLGNEDSTILTIWQYSAGD